METPNQHSDATSSTLCEEFADIMPAVHKASDESFAIIAGPCSAETEEQTLTTARQLAQQDIKVFRAGLWKPRTRPGSFEGCGEAGLKWLQAVKKETGMTTATEVATPHHAELAMKAGVDILWLGARTTVNPFAVQDIADALRGTDVAVLIKNPANPDLDLWIGAMQRIHNAGIRRLGAIHRGFSAYGSKFYRNPPQWRIPIELHRLIPRMQLIADPSHIGGKRNLIAPLAQQAIDLGFNGLIIEAHCCPNSALSDASQQITPRQLRELIDGITIRGHKNVGSQIDALRHQIDTLDSELLDLLARRMNVALEIGRLKKMNNMPVLQPERYETLMKARVDEAAALGLDREFTSAILAAIHAESVNRQLNLTD